MSHSDADRNLLVGMLALQLNFVSREQLIAATGQWTRDKQKPLSQILLDQGHLSADESQMLAGLVDMHLARHGNDALQSLASIDVASAAQEVVAAAGDESLQETINQLVDYDPHETMLPQHEATAPFDDRFVTAPPTADIGEGPTVKLPTPLIPTAPGEHPPTDDPGRATPTPGYAASANRFSIIKPYQRGGLGQVSIARDQEINREVALKEILPKHADSQEARQRFLLEAEITGSLEHPGVVPVYGLGQYGDGRPYYAMRFIRGDNLQLAIDDFHRGGGIKNRDLGFRQLLSRFIDVCNAIEYAHNRCVLHRDLKPGNIMLGKYGETLVVDWGLAKSLDAEEVPTDTVEMPVRPLGVDTSTETQMGRVVGTPAYMSPEQAAGRVDLLGPATDIYSLGATLFHLLTGEAPFTGTPRTKLIEAVRGGKFKPPRQVKSDIPQTLAAICLKAMALEPEDRYLTAQALADDIERFLADEPVQAFREPWHARAFRWMRKHRALVVSAAGILTVTAIALTLGVVLLGAANRREMAQRELAEHNFKLARNAVRDYFTSVSEDTLLKQSGMQPLRNQLLSQALSYYEEFLRSGPSEAEMRDEVAQANYYVGRIKEAVDSPTAALPFFDTAIAYYEQLLGETPRDRERLDQFGLTLNAKGRALQRLDQLDESRKYYQRARVARQLLADADPEDRELARQLANSVMNLGTIDVLAGEEVSGMQLWGQAQELRKAQLLTDADQPLLKRDLGKGSFNLGNLHLNRGETEAAFQHLIQAVGYFEELTVASPDDMEAQLNLAQTYRTLGDLQLPEEGDASQALAYYDRAVELLTALSLRNPQVPSYSAQLAGAEITVAEVLIEDAQQERALAALANSIEKLRGLVEQYPNVPTHRTELAYALQVSGDLKIEQGQADLGRADLARAATHLEELARRYPADRGYSQQLEALRSELDELAADQQE